MTISDGDLKRWEERWRQASFPDNWWNAVNRLRSNPDEKEVQLTVPGPVFTWPGTLISPMIWEGCSTNW